MKQYTVIKYNDILGYIDLESKPYWKSFTISGNRVVESEFMSLNKAIMIDGSVVMVGDDVEVIDDDRSRKFIKEVVEFYNR